MAFNQKVVRLAQDISDALTLEGLTVATSYDASSDVYLTVTDPSVIGVDALIKLVKAAQLGNNQANPVTGLVEEVFTPHIIQVGYGSAAAGSSTETIGAALAAGDAVTIAGNAFTSVDSGAAGDQWNITGTFASGTATLLAALTAGDSGTAADLVTINTHAFTAKNTGAAGDEFNLTGTPASATVTVGADLTAGDKVTLAGHDFTSIDAGAAGDQWNITGVQATGWTLLNTVIVGNQVVINGSTFTGIAGATDAANNFHVGISDAATALELRDAINNSVDVLIAGLITAAVDGTTAEQVNVNADAKGTSGNAFTLGGAPTSATFSFSDGTPGASGLFGIGVGAVLGSVNTAACATSLIAAIAGSVTVGIAGIFNSVTGGAGVASIVSDALGTLRNGSTLATTGGATHLLASAATLTSGALDLTASAVSLAAAISGSVTVGIAGVVSATSALAVVSLTADIKGTSGNVALTETGTGYTVSGATLTGGSVNVTTSAAALAAAINDSVTVGIAGVVTATSALGVVTVTAVAGGTGGNAITTTSTGAIVSANAALIGGSDVGTSNVVRYKTLIEAILKGTQVEVYEKASAIAITDIGVVGNLTFTYRNIQWGFIAHM